MESQVIMPFAQLGRSVTSLVFDSGPFAKFILLLLFVMSVISWAIIYDRARLYMRLTKNGRRLQMAFASKGLGISVETLKKFLPSVEGALLVETRRFAESREQTTGSGRGGLKSLRQLLDGRAMTEISEMEKYLIFLATTASVSPFLGLLGTVWGIMNSFLSMGSEGTASIEVVGPGIAEALITTIAGLGAAITALIGYNLLVRHVRRQESRVELFISRILEVADAGPSEGSYANREAPLEKRSI